MKPRQESPCRRQRSAGHAFLFTLLLVALLSVSILVATEIDSTLARREREQALLQVGHEFREALARYHTGRGIASRGQYPLQIEDLLLDRRYPATARHLRRVYADPITGKTEWGIVRQGGRIIGLHSMSPLQPIKQDDFAPDDATFQHARSYREWVFTYPATLALPPAAAASAPPASFAPQPLAPPALSAR